MTTPERRGIIIMEIEELNNNDWLKYMKETIKMVKSDNWKDWDYNHGKIYNSNNI